MNVKSGLFEKPGMLATGILLVLLAYAPHADANVMRIHFSGAAGSGYADLTLANDADASSNYPNAGDMAPATRYDPADVQHITGATGIFNGNIITGVQPLNGAPLPPPPVGPEYLPKSYSFIPIPGVGDGDGVSYDNLFYLNGSSKICLGVNPDGTTFLKYPFSGGFLDIFGVMFTLDNGHLVDLWSFGHTPPGFFGPTWSGGLAYGMKILIPDATVQGGYRVPDLPPIAMAYVPEPGFIWLFGAGLVGLFAWRRATDKKRRQ